MDPASNPTVTQPRASRGWAAVLIIGVAASAMLIGASTLSHWECTNPTDDWRTNPCLNHHFYALMLVLAMPFIVLVALLVAAGLRLLLFRDAWAAVLYPFALFVVTNSMGRLAAALNGQLHAGTGQLPWTLWLAIGVGVLVACWLPVRRAQTPWWGRLAPVLLIVAVAAAVPTLADAAERTALSSHLDEAPTGLHLPNFPGLPLESVSVRPGVSGPQYVSMFYRDDETGRTAYFSLVAAQGLDTCDALQPAGREEVCPVGADVFTATTSYGDAVAIHRHGDTILRASSGDLAHEVLATAIADSQEVDTETVIAALPPGRLK